MKFNPLILIFFTLISFSQVGIGTSSPQAALDIESSTSGILIPRLSEVQKNIIVNPEESTLIYQHDNSRGFYYFDGVNWVNLNNSISSSRLEIGDYYMGGIIFHLEPDGKHGLIVALDRVNRGAWGSRWLFRRLSNRSIYSGMPNSALMLDFSQIARNANRLVSNGYGGWHVPSYDEMQLIVDNLLQVNNGLTNNGGRTFNSTQIYWTSTEISTTNAFAYNAVRRMFLSEDKNASYISRGVRRF